MSDAMKGRSGRAKAGGPLLFTSAVARLGQTRAVVLLAAQPDPKRPAEYLLDATLVPEQPLEEGPLRLVANWKDERRTAAIDRAGCAHLRGIPAEVLEALQAGDHQALVLQIEHAASQGDALG